MPRVPIRLTNAATRFEIRRLKAEAELAEKRAAELETRAATGRRPRGYVQETHERVRDALWQFARNLGYTSDDDYTQTEVIMYLRPAMAEILDACRCRHGEVA